MAWPKLSARKYRQSRFRADGKATVEISRAEAGENDFWRLGYAGDTLNTTWYARACLPPGWQVEHLARLGADPFSARMREFLTEVRIDTSLITRDPIRSIGLHAIESQDIERSFAQTCLAHMTDQRRAESL